MDKEIQLVADPLVPGRLYNIRCKTLNGRAMYEETRSLGRPPREEIRELHDCLYIQPEWISAANADGIWRPSDHPHFYYATGKTGWHVFAFASAKDNIYRVRFGYFALRNLLGFEGIENETTLNVNLLVALEVGPNPSGQQRQRTEKIQKFLDKTASLADSLECDQKNRFLDALKKY